MNYKKLVLVIVSLGLFLIPFILWGNSYLVGGDDTKLYYVFPKEFLTNYAFNIASDNTLGGAMTGYQSVAYFAPFFALVYLCKVIPFINTQMFFYGLNFVLGFLFFYKFLSLYLDNKTIKGFLITIFSSIMYVLSPFTLKTLFTHQLIALYLVSTIPATLYFFINGIQTNKSGPILLSVVIFSLGSTTINTLPWWGAFCISLLPLLIYEFVQNFKYALRGSILWICSFFLLNMYWIFHVMYAALHNTGLGSVTSYYTSSNFIADNIRIITGVSRIFSPLAVQFFIMDSQFPKNIHLLDYLQLIFISCILIAGFIIAKNKLRKRNIYIVSLFSFLISWLLFSPNLGDFGVQSFLFFSNHIPLFTMFRNMYDKFSLSLAFSFAFCFAISVTILAQYVKNSRWFILIYIMLIVTLFHSTFTSLAYVKTQTSTSTSFSGNFDANFVHLTNFFREKNESSHVLWLPLNSPTYVNIQDATFSSHQYGGLSPMRELANTSDYAGKYSFIRQNNLFLGDTLFQNIQNANDDEVGKFLQQVNTKYIIVNHLALTVSQQNFFFGGQNKPVLISQNDMFYQALLGDKVADFGLEYSVYKINQKYNNEKIYLTTDYSKFPTNFSNLRIKKESNDMYTITISRLSSDTKLVFLEPFNTDWDLSIIGQKGNIPFAQNKNKLVFGYANGWDISLNDLKKIGPQYFYLNQDGTINVTLQLSFAARKYNTITYFISLLSWVVSLGYITYYYGKNKK